MSNNGLGKLIGYWIAWILTIWWATVMITQDDIAKEYKANTWRELTIDKSELSTFQEIAKETKEAKVMFEEFYNWIDCVNYEYDFPSSCEEVKTSLKTFINAIDSAVVCYDKMAKDEDLEKSDLVDCISSERTAKDAAEQVFLKMEWSCNADCQSTLDASEYNIAVFQAYLNKVD